MESNLESKKEQIKIDIINIYCDEEDDLIRLRRFYKELNQISQKYLLPMGKKHCEDDIVISYEKSTYKNLCFKPLQYTYDRMIFRDTRIRIN